MSELSEQRNIPHPKYFPVLNGEGRFNKERSLPESRKEQRLV